MLNSLLFPFCFLDSEENQNLIKKVKHYLSDKDFLLFSPFPPINAAQTTTELVALKYVRILLYFQHAHILKMKICKEWFVQQPLQ